MVLKLCSQEPEAGFPQCHLRGDLSFTLTLAKQEAPFKSALYVVPMNNIFLEENICLKKKKDLLEEKLGKILENFTEPFRSQSRKTFHRRAL